MSASKNISKDTTPECLGGRCVSLSLALLEVKETNTLILIVLNSVLRAPGT